LIAAQNFEVLFEIKHVILYDSFEYRAHELGHAGADITAFQPVNDRHLHFGSPVSQRISEFDLAGIFDR
jgi:hypothetical protein